MTKFRGTLLSSVGHALHGLFQVIKRERNFKWISLCAIGAIFVALWVGLSAWEWALGGIAIGILLSAEIFNTAIEMTVDLVTKKKKYRAKLAKDMAAGGVFLIALISIVVWAWILCPKLLKMV
jgi:diacylglycerol kinase